MNTLSILVLAKMDAERNFDATKSSLEGAMLVGNKTRAAQLRQHLHEKLDAVVDQMQAQCDQVRRGMP